MQPQVQTLDQILAELDPAYAPQRQIFQQQQALLPGQEQAALTGLEVGKQNAFRDVNTMANAKGLAFSGIPAAEQTRYLGEKYLPAVASTKGEFQKQNLTLAQALAALAGEQRIKAIDTRGGQQKVLDAYLEAERDRQFRAAEAEKQRRADAALSAAKSRAGGVDLQLKKNARGGWEVLEDGKPSQNYDLATAADLLGKDLVSLLEQGDAQDRQAATWYKDNVSQVNRTGGGDAAVAMQYAKNQLRKDRSTAFYLGGAY